MYIQNNAITKKIIDYCKRDIVSFSSQALIFPTLVVGKAIWPTINCVAVGANFVVVLNQLLIIIFFSKTSNLVYASTCIEISTIKLGHVTYNKFLCHLLITINL